MLIIYNIYYLYMKNFKLQTIYIIGTQLCTINVYWTVKKIYTIWNFEYQPYESWARPCETTDWA